MTEYVSGDLDFFALLLPSSRLLILDTYFGEGIIDDKSYETAAEAENLRVIRFDGKGNGYYPLNGLVITRTDGDVVFYDKRAKDLGRLLSDEGIAAVPVNLPDDCALGKIRCATNVRSSEGPAHHELLSAGCYG